jgi:acyl-coenzyme A thioesterase PaaI-like protein
MTESGRFEVSPHACFACGELNAHGLHLDLHVAGDLCWTELVLDPDFQGWEGIAHGGIVATILDEVMGWALATQDAWGYTAKMSLEYRRPVPIGARVRGEGRLVERRRRLLKTTGRLVDPVSGEVYATAEALYVAAPEARRAELKARYGFRLVADTGTPAGGTPASGTPESRTPDNSTPEASAATGDAP